MNVLFDGHPNFRIKRRLAVGGMGEVFLLNSQSHPDLADGLLVVKTPPTGIKVNQEILEMLEEEGRLAMRLHHENIIETFQVDDVENIGTVLLMQYINGPSFSDILAQALKLNKKLPTAFVLHVFRETVYGLHFAHTLKNQYGHSIGLIHRDISPANVLMTVFGDVKLIDFGVAKSNDSQVHTQTGTMKGKLSYMPPEQIKGFKPDAQADIWALGVFLWESLTVSRLFTGNTFQAVIHQVLNFPLPPPSALNEKIGHGTDALTLKLLERNPEERFKSCREILELIESWDLKWTKSDSLALIQELFPRRAKKWIHEGNKISRHLHREPPPSGLVDGGVFEIQYNEFDELEPTQTTRTSGFDWSSFGNDTTSTKSHSGLMVKKDTGDTNTFPKFPPSHTDTLESGSTEGSNLYSHEDPWAELTATRELFSKPKTMDTENKLFSSEEWTDTSINHFRLSAFGKESEKQEESSEQDVPIFSPGSVLPSVDETADDEKITTPVAQVTKSKKNLFYFAAGFIGFCGLIYYLLS